MRTITLKATATGLFAAAIALAAFSSDANAGSKKRGFEAVDDCFFSTLGDRVGCDNVYRQRKVQRMIPPPPPPTPFPEENRNIDYSSDGGGEGGEGGGGGGGGGGGDGGR